MALNKSTGNMYEFVTHTWNTIKGKCPHECSYCYMKRWGEQHPVHFDEKELKTDLGSGNFIFVGSSCDMFAEPIPTEWIVNTLQKCNQHDNKYFFQSKDPHEMIGFAEHMHRDTSICTTIETNRVYSDVMAFAPSPQYRAGWMAGTKLKKYVTVEPIMDFDLAPMVELIKLCEPIQVNLGADSGNNHLPEPPKEKILELIDELSKFTTIHNKKNLARLMKE